MGYGNLVEHSFYCIKCGNCGIPLVRNRGFRHEKFHRKKLYCIVCKQEINHVECKNEEEVAEFLEDYDNGKFVEEAAESVSYVRNTGLR